MEYHFNDDKHVTYTSPCSDRSGLFSDLPSDPISILRTGFPPSFTDEELKIRFIPADLPLVVMSEVAWFVQITRSDHAYDTYGSVNKQGISVSEDLYRAHSWSEFADWYDLLTQVRTRYILDEDQFCQLRVVACHMFTRRRLGIPFKVFLCSSTEMRGIYVDIMFQNKVTSNPCPFVPKKVDELDVGQKTCIVCHSICTTTCKRCKKVPYCSKKCLNSDYQRHKKLCRKLLVIVPLKECAMKHQQKKFRIPELKYLR